MLRVATTALRGGQLLCDYLPISVKTLNVKLMNHGTFTGTMVVNADFENYRDKILPGRTVLWVLDEQIPIWCGVLWDWDHSSEESGMLDINAQTFGSLLNRRVISDAMSWTNTQPYDIFKDIVNYTLAKTGGEISNLAPEKFRTDPFTTTPMTRAYQGSDHSNLWETLVDIAGDAGFEFDFVPSLTLDPLAFAIRLSPEVPLHTAVPTLTYPGNVDDFSYPTTTSGVATYVRVTGSAADNSYIVSAYPHGVDEPAIADSWPLLETVVAAGTATGIAQADVDTRADVELAMLAKSRSLPEVTVTTGRGGIEPSAIGLSDRVNLALQSNLYGMISTTMRVVSVDYIIQDNFISAIKLGLV